MYFITKPAYFAKRYFALKQLWWNLKLWKNYVYDSWWKLMVLTIIHTVIFDVFFTCELFPKIFASVYSLMADSLVKNINFVCHFCHWARHNIKLKQMCLVPGGSKSGTAPSNFIKGEIDGLLWLFFQHSAWEILASTNASLFVFFFSLLNIHI